MFEIVDHCFEPKISTGQDGYTLDQVADDVCQFPRCGKPELAHAWTVEAYMSNELSIQQTT